MNCPNPNCKEILNKNNIGYVQNGDMIYRLSLSGKELEYEEDEFDSNQSGLFFCRACGLELPEKYQDERVIIKLLKTK